MQIDRLRKSSVTVLAGADFGGTAVRACFAAVGEAAGSARTGFAAALLRAGLGAGTGFAAALAGAAARAADFFAAAAPEPLAAFFAGTDAVFGEESTFRAAEGFPVVFAFVFPAVFAAFCGVDWVGMSSDS